VRSAANHRLVVIAIDGLAKSEISSLAHYADFASQLDNCLNLKTAQPAVSAQSAWSEILTGQPWTTLNCPGHVRPKDSLNFCEFVSEEGLNHPVSLLPKRDGKKAIAINMPLLVPFHSASNSDRLWLSDGSLPIQTAVSPGALLSNAPFDIYRPRPFVSCAQALLDLPTNLKAALAIEANRLDCAVNLIEKTDWQVCFLRITIFDLLSHLLGPQYLEGQNKLAWPAIQDFLIGLNVALNQIMRLCKEDSVVVLSTLHHTSCHGRLNLNRLLSSQGLCRIEPLKSGDDLAVLERRRQASIAVSQKAGEHAQTITSTSHRFNTAKTLVASPVSGTIYINSMRQFQDGIVTKGQEDAFTEQVSGWLHSNLARHFPTGNFAITSCKQPSPTQAKANSSQRQISDIMEGPQLTVSIPGIELHDSLYAPVLDRENHPRSTHAYEGFVWMKDMGKSKVSDTITTIDLNRRLLAALE